MLATKPNSKKRSLPWHPSYCHHPRKATEHTSSTSIARVQPSLQVRESHQTNPFHNVTNNVTSKFLKKWGVKVVLPDGILATAVVLKLEIQNLLMSKQRP